MYIQFYIIGISIEMRDGGIQYGKMRRILQIFREKRQLLWEERGYSQTGRTLYRLYKKTQNDRLWRIQDQ